MEVPLGPLLPTGWWEEYTDFSLEHRAPFKPLQGGHGGWAHLGGQQTGQIDLWQHLLAVALPVRFLRFYQFIRGQHLQGGHGWSFHGSCPVLLGTRPTHSLTHSGFSQGLGVLSWRLMEAESQSPA